MACGESAAAVGGGGTSASNEMQCPSNRMKSSEVTLPFRITMSLGAAWAGWRSGSSCGITSRGTDQKSGTVRTIDAEMCSATSSRSGPGSSERIEPSEKTVFTRRKYL